MAPRRTFNQLFHISKLDMVWRMAAEENEIDIAEKN